MWAAGQRYSAHLADNNDYWDVMIPGDERQVEQLRQQLDVATRATRAAEENHHDARVCVWAFVLATIPTHFLLAKEVVLTHTLRVHR